MTKLRVNVEDYHLSAKEKLPRLIYDYYASGSDDQITLNKTVKDFNKIKLLPRVLVDVSKQDMTTELFGEKVRTPILIAPTAMHKMANPEGEVATAKAAASLGTIYTMSSLSTTKIPDVAAASQAPKWFQLYVLKDRKLSEATVRQVEQAGFKALVLTVDTPLLGRRLNDIRNSFKLPYGLELEVFKGLPLTNLPTGLLGFVAQMLDKSLDWTAIEWLKSITKLPVIVKGILSPEDAVLAVKHGADGIIVSNHGARQLDTVPSTIEVLPFIVQAVSGKVPVIFDGGIRRGTDILKAIAYGAKAVMVGRPVLWGLAHDGQCGVEEVMKILEEEFRVAMALSGCGKVSDITRELIYDRRKYARL